MIITMITELVLRQRTEGLDDVPTGEDGTVIESPLVSDIAVVLAVVFLLVRTVYGLTVGTVKKAADIPTFMAKGVKDLAPVLVLFFAASQFLAYFSWSGMAEVLSIRGAAWLEALDMPTPVLLVSFILMATTMNLLITSGSTQ